MMRQIREHALMTACYNHEILQNGGSWSGKIWALAAIYRDRAELSIFSFLLDEAVFTAVLAALSQRPSSKLSGEYLR